jgi:hypothetical protein
MSNRIWLKEIILKFSGGSFQGKYICRNCGQAIKDFDFDNNIEYFKLIKIFQK